MKRLALSFSIAFALVVCVLALVRAADGPLDEAATIGDTVLSYQVAVPDATQKRIVISGTISGLDASSLTLARPWAWAGVLPPVDDLVIADSGGTPFTYTLDVVGDPGMDGHHLYTIDNTSGVNTVRFSYVVSMAAMMDDYGHGPVAYWHFEPSEYTVIESHLMFLQPVSTPLAALTMTFDLPSEWIPVSRLFRRDDYYQAIVTDTVKYGTPRETYRLWGLIGLGQFEVFSDTTGGVEFIVAVPRGNAALGPEIAASRFAANRYASQHLWPLGDGTTPLRYINIYPKPISDYAFTSRDHCHGHLGLISDTVDLVAGQQGMTHVTLHDWFLHSGLDYPQWDVLHPEMWAEENLIDYFAVRVAHESGNWSAEEANAEWLSMYNAYTSTILGTSDDVPLIDPGAITGTAQYILWYKKGALVHHLFDHQVRQVTEGTKSIEYVFRFLHNHIPNTESHRLGADDFLLAYNLVTGHDFESFFDAYVTGVEPLPFVVVSDTLQIDEAALPETPQLAPLSLVRLALKAGLADTDTDGDGLLDWVETHIGTEPASDDSDHDGLADREEFGAVTDGLPGEYVSDVPLVTDPSGDSLGSAPGLDVTGLYATGFKDEHGAAWLYLTLQVTDEQYNPDGWYEIFLSTADSLYQYRFDEWDSYLWRQEGNDHIEISGGRIEADFRDQLEVLVPLDLLENPLTVTVRGFTRYGEQEDPSWGLKEVDATDWSTASTAPRIFVSDPVNPDTDGDGASDGIEVQFSSDPADATETVWPVWLPMLSRSPQ